MSLGWIAVCVVLFSLGCIPVMIMIHNHNKRRAAIRAEDEFIDSIRKPRRPAA